MRFAEQVASCVERMARSEAQRWERETLPQAARVERGVYYEGGPVVLVAYDADDNRLQSVVASDVEIGGRR